MGLGSAGSFIKDRLITAKPYPVVAPGRRHINGYEDVACLTVYFDTAVIAHTNLNLLFPVKPRNTLLGDEKNVLV